MSHNFTVFTIVSKNYLHYAINLMRSVRKHLPDARRVVALCDRSEGLDLTDLPFEVIELESLEIPNLDRLLYQYSILELNTAIKPFVFSHLFAASPSKVIYFDPDIQLFSSGEELLNQLDHHDVILTPHLTDFLEDDRHPSDLAILQSGTYNLGFLGLRRSDTATRLLKWWQNKLLRDCVVDIPRGLFTDQKWMDLIPGIFDRVHIERHPGWNVAYWNLPHREIIERDNEFLVNGHALFFFHFSGYNGGTGSISKHQDRYVMKDLPVATQKLFRIYGQNVDQCGRAQFAPLPYAFSTLYGGIPLPDIGRIVLRNQLTWREGLPDFRTAEGEAFIIDFLNQPEDRESPVITRLALACHRQRVDLQAAFPDVMRINRSAFLAWFNTGGRREHHLDDAFFPALANLPITVKAGSFSANAAEYPAAAGQTLKPTLGNRIYQTAFRVAWPVRSYVRPFLGAHGRQRVAQFLLRQAYEQPLATLEKPVKSAPGTDNPVASPKSSISSSLDFLGINLIGYVRAESGIGESSRATIRCLTAVGIPFSIIDFRTGNVSRMGEHVESSQERGLSYGINLFHINADQLNLAVSTLGEDNFAGGYSIGYWAWELEHFPEEWVGAFKRLDEVWVPSTFCQRAIAEKSPVPVLCVPHSVVHGQPSAPDRQRFGLRQDSVVFLTMADLLSISERKNPLGVVEAFARAFKNDDQAVELVVKLSNVDADPKAFKQMQQIADGFPNIHFIEGYLDRKDLSSLFDSADCFVSLHRSEGFGLGMAEAMVRGKVVIGTGWSGNTDFMNTSNSLLVSYRLIPLEKDFGPYRKGELWADPDMDDAARKMQMVATQADLRLLIGSRAQMDCQMNLSPAMIGNTILNRLNRISVRILPKYKKEWPQ
jgi:glycosyltransferase involved in cell wall biosynthesis